MNPEIMKIPEVENIEIKDFGCIKKADIKFTKGLNLIIGKNGSGKTTVINYLVNLFDINSMSTGQRMMFYINNEINKNCLVLDGPLYRLVDKNLIKTLKSLEKCNRQVIATLCLPRHDFIKNKIKVNIIKTEDFELKNDIPML